MEKKRNMTISHITAKLRSFLKNHKNDLTYASTRFAAADVINFEVCIEENYQGKDYYSFSGKIEIKDPQKDYITDRIPVRGRVYIEEGEDCEPKFGEVEKIFIC